MATLVGVAQRYSQFWGILQTLVWVWEIGGWQVSMMISPWDSSLAFTLLRASPQLALSTPEVLHPFPPLFVVTLPSKLVLGSKNNHSRSSNNLPAWRAGRRRAHARPGYGSRKKCQRRLVARVSARGGVGDAAGFGSMNPLWGAGFAARGAGGRGGRLGEVLRHEPEGPLSGLQPEVRRLRWRCQAGGSDSGSGWERRGGRGAGAWGPRHRPEAPHGCQLLSGKRCRPLSQSIRFFLPHQLEPTGRGPSCPAWSGVLLEGSPLLSTRPLSIVFQLLCLDFSFSSPHRSACLSPFSELGPSLLTLTTPHPPPPATFPDVSSSSSSWSFPWIYACPPLLCLFIEQISEILNF